MLRLFMCPHVFHRHTKMCEQNLKGLIQHEVLRSVCWGKVLSPPAFSPRLALLLCSCELSVRCPPRLMPLVALRQKLGRSETLLWTTEPWGGVVVARSMRILFSAQSFVCEGRDDYFSDVPEHWCCDPNTVS